MSHPLIAFPRMFDFDGRSRRRETIGFIGLAGAAIAAVALWEEQTGQGRAIAGIAGPVTVIVALLLALPLIASVVRRLHDTGRPAAAIGMLAIPVFGQMLFLRWLVSPGQRGANRFGIDPRGAERGAVAPVVYPFRRM